MKDLKPANILAKIKVQEGRKVAANDVQLKIVDYGFFGKFIFNNRPKLRHGGLYFVSPEVIKKEDVDSDLWSVGVLLCLLLTGKPPFDGDVRSAIVSGILGQTKMTIPDDELDLIPDDARDLMLQLLTNDPFNRIEATDAMNHDWIMRLTKVENVMDSV